MNSRPLIILGASARAAAQSAIRAGFRPHPIDLFADEDLRALSPRQIERYPVAFLTALATAPQTPWMYTGSLENYPRLITRLAKLRPLLGNGPAVLRKVRDPRWLAALLANSPVRYPETVIAGSGMWAAGCEEQGYVLKPLRSGGGMGIRRVRREDASSASKRQVLQQVIVGQPISASFSVINGEVFWIGAAEQWIGAAWGAPQEFQYAGSLAPFVLSEDEESDLRRVAKAIATAAGITGLCGLDLVRSEQGLWLIEVNPRYTASMELFESLSDRRLIAEHCGELPGAAPLQFAARSEARASHVCAAKLFVFADRAGACGDALQAAMQNLPPGITAADVPRRGTRFEFGNPICTLLTGNVAEVSREMIRQQLLSAATVVRGSLDP